MTDEFDYISRFYQTFYMANHVDSLKMIESKRGIIDAALCK